MVASTVGTLAPAGALSPFRLPDLIPAVVEQRGWLKPGV